jgi:hypothetical protein
MYNVESYIKDHPEVAIIDPLDSFRKLLDRYQSYSIIHNSDLKEAGKNTRHGFNSVTCDTEHTGDYYFHSLL